MGGCWERLIRSVKSGLKAMLPANYTPTPEILQSALIEIEAIINSRPLPYVPLDNSLQEAITPRQLLLGSNGDVKSMGTPDVDGPILRLHWKTSQILAQRFWHSWIQSYRPTLLLKSKWYGEEAPNLQVGDIVVIIDENDKNRQWPKGRVVKIHESSDGRVRKATVQTVNGTLVRPAVKLARLHLENSGTSSTPGGVDNAR